MFSAWVKFLHAVEGPPALNLGQVTPPSVRGWGLVHMPSLGQVAPPFVRGWGLIQTELGAAHTAAFARLLTLPHRTWGRSPPPFARGWGVWVGGSPMPNSGSSCNHSRVVGAHLHRACASTLPVCVRFGANPAELRGTPRCPPTQSLGGNMFIVVRHTQKHQRPPLSAGSWL